MTAEIQELISMYLQPNSDIRATEMNEICTKIATEIDSKLVGTTFIGSVKPVDTPTGTGTAFWVATQSGTYTNFGGVVVSANSFAVISRDGAGAFSISQTAFDITSKVNVSDIADNLTTDSATKVASSRQVKVLNEKNIKIELNTDFLRGLKYVNYANSQASAASNAIKNIKSWVSNNDLNSEYSIKTIGWQASNNRILIIFFKNGVSFYTFQIGSVTQIPTGVLTYSNNVGAFRFELTIDWSLLTTFFDGDATVIKLFVESYESSLSYNKKAATDASILALETRATSSETAITNNKTESVNLNLKATDNLINLSKLSLSYIDCAVASNVADNVILANGNYTSSVGNSFKKLIVVAGDIVKIKTTVANSLIGFYIDSNAGTGSLIGTTITIPLGFEQIFIVPATATRLMINIMAGATVTVQKAIDTLTRVVTAETNIAAIQAGSVTINSLAGVDTTFVNLSKLALAYSDYSFTSNVANTVIVANGNYATSTGNNFKKYIVNAGESVLIKSSTDSLAGFYIDATASTGSLIGTTFTLKANLSTYVVAPATTTRFMINVMSGATVTVQRVSNTLARLTAIENTINTVGTGSETSPAGAYASSGLEFTTNLTTPKLLGRIALYQGDTSVNPIVNNVFLDNGDIVACRSNGNVVLKTLAGVETVLLTITGADQWRGTFRSKKGDVFISPYHATDRTKNGIWKLNPSKTGFTQVCTWYNASIPDEATIWLFTEDRNGNIYAAVYDQLTLKPQIYKSTNDGTTWTMIVDFNAYLGETTIRHMHALHYDKWNNALYASLGEGDYNYKSIDGGTTWTHICIGMGKMTGIMSTPYCRIFGTDVGGSSDLLSMEIYTTTDDIVYTKVYSTWSQNLFGFRLSDVTGWIYGFTLIDSSVNDANYFPPVEAITDPAALQTWKNTNPQLLTQWNAYNAKYASEYPLDCIRPQHASIICSKDGGTTWEVLFKHFTPTGSRGFYMAGEMRFGECLFGLRDEVFLKPICISEHNKGRKPNGEIDLTGTILHNNF